MTSDAASSFADRLRRAIETTGVSQKVICDATGQKADVISRLVLGKNAGIKLGLLAPLARFFEDRGISGLWLVADIGPMQGAERPGLDQFLALAPEELLQELGQRAADMALIQQILGLQTTSRPDQERILRKLMRPGRRTPDSPDRKGM